MNDLAHIPYSSDPDDLPSIIAMAVQQARVERANVMHDLIQQVPSLVKKLFARFQGLHIHSPRFGAWAAR